VTYAIHTLFPFQHVRSFTSVLRAASISYQHPIDILSTSYRHPINILSISYRHPINILSISYRHPINILSTSYQYPIDILSTSYQYPINILSISYPNFKADRRSFTDLSKCGGHVKFSIKELCATLTSKWRLL
jgi:hypothetical protein